MLRRVPFVVLVSLLATLATAQSDLIDKVKTLPGVVDVKTAGRAGNEFLDISFEQPVDHKNPGGAKFTQHVFLAHTGFDKPVLLATEGYTANGPGGGELRRMLGEPNRIGVEHRYFGRSIPSPLVWEHLTVKNAADDMHVIVTSFKKLYSGKWVATGASKSGQTSLFFKCYYPNDVDVTVAYVAPINLAQEDPRINQFMENVGDPETRKKVKDFQIALLKREDEVLPLLGAMPEDYSLGVAKAYEYGVLEFPYAFWQYGSNARADSIPSPDAPAQTLADAYKRVNAMFYYSDRGIKTFEAFQYQAYTEIGYYNYDITDFAPYLRANKNPTNMDLCPAGTKDTIVYNPATMAFVYPYLQYKANKVVYIYGETDPWSSTALPLLGRTDALRIMVKGAWHNASIRLASPEQQEQFYAAMERWLGIKLVRPNFSWL